MFKFFTTRQWFGWSILGTLAILFSTWYQVQLDVQINQWFGSFYDTLQRALSKPGAVSLSEFNAFLFSFAKIAGLWMIIVVVTNYFISHYIFRWRTSMADYYHSKWDSARSLEGASQRVQEDTLKFARIMEGLGVGMLEAVMVLAAFVPILWTLSLKVTELPFIGTVEHALVWVAVLTALGGTVLLALVGWRLPGIEYDVQKVEAGYRKELVMGEDSTSRGRPATLSELFSSVRIVHFRSYFNYMYFNVAKYSYLQGMVIIPYLSLGPTIITGAITLGMVQQIIRAFGKVAESLQFLVRSWSTIVELISVWKRLREFERRIDNA